MEFELSVEVGIRSNQFLRLVGYLKIEFEFRTQLYGIGFQYKSLSVNSLEVSKELEFQVQN